MNSQITHPKKRTSVRPDRCPDCGADAEVIAKYAGCFCNSTAEAYAKRRRRLERSHYSPKLWLPQKEVIS